MSRILILAIVVAGFCTILSTAQNFPAQERDRNICKQNADQRTFVKGTKEKANDCRVHCTYQEADGTEATEVYDSENDQLCCDIGAVPTGTCKDGKCPVDPASMMGTMG